MKTYRVLKDIEIDYGITVKAGATIEVKNINCMATPEEIFEEVKEWHEGCKQREKPTNCDPGFYKPQEEECKHGKFKAWGICGQCVNEEISEEINQEAAAALCPKGGCKTCDAARCKHDYCCEGGNLDQSHNCWKKPLTEGVKECSHTSGETEEDGRFYCDCGAIVKPQPKQLPSEWIERRVDDLLPVNWDDNDVREQRVWAILDYLDFKANL